MYVMLTKVLIRNNVGKCFITRPVDKPPVGALYDVRVECVLHCNIHACICVRVCVCEFERADALMAIHLKLILVAEKGLSRGTLK